MGGTYVSIWCQNGLEPIGFVHLCLRQLSLSLNESNLIQSQGLQVI